MHSLCSLASTISMLGEKCRRDRIAEAASCESSSMALRVTAHGPEPHREKSIVEVCASRPGLSRAWAATATRGELLRKANTHWDVVHLG